MGRPELTFPPEVAEHVKSRYKAASVILEYGSGGSTAFAADLPGKRIFSIESDAAWAADLRDYFRQAKPPSPPSILYVDIGETGRWGRVIDDRAWARFHLYPLWIWDQPFFRAPDLVLIDGRFRAACLATCLFRAEQPLKVLFDDYVDRPAYHAVERFVEPSLRIGRMAEFDIVPSQLPREALAMFIGLFTKVTLAQGSVDYSETPEV